jgi:hypothetical protein
VEDRVMRALLVVFLLAAAVARAEPRYAVLSLLSDNFTIITRDMATGSNLDRNRRVTVAVPGNVLDKTMVLAMDDALRAAGVKSPAVLLFTSDPAIFARQHQLLDDSAGTAALLDAVRPVLKGVDANYLVLASKYRRDARIQVEDGYVGSGPIEGLGFYIDREYQPRRVGVISIAPGYLAVFTYFRLSLIDLASGRVVREVPVFASRTRLGTEDRSESGHPWDSMSPQEKVDALSQLLRSETPAAMKQLLSP